MHISVTVCCKSNRSLGTNHISCYLGSKFLFCDALSIFIGNVYFSICSPKKLSILWCTYVFNLLGIFPKEFPSKNRSMPLLMMSAWHSLVKGKRSFVLTTFLGSRVVRYTISVLFVCCFTMWVVLPWKILYTELPNKLPSTCNQTHLFLTEIFRIAFSL